MACLLLTQVGCQPAAPAVAPSGGNESYVPKPQRIISLNLCTDQLLLQLVEPQRITALSKLAHDPEMSVLAEQAQKLPIVQGGTEEVLQRKPDLVLVGKYTTRYTTQMLRQLGIRVVEVPLPSSLEEVVQQIELVSTTVGETGRGKELVQRIRQRQAALAQARQGDPKQWPVAAERSWMGYSNGHGTLQNELLDLAGYRNAGVLAGLKGYGYLPLERLVAARPDLMVTPDYGRGLPSIERRDELHPALQHTPLQELVMPTRMTICGGIWSLDAARALAQRQHEAH